MVTNSDHHEVFGCNRLYIHQYTYLQVTVYQILLLEDTNTSYIVILIAGVSPLKLST